MRRPSPVNRIDPGPDVLVLILPDVERRMRPEQRARPGPLVPTIVPGATALAFAAAVPVALRAAAAPARAA